MARQGVVAVALGGAGKHSHAHGDGVIQRVSFQPVGPTSSPVWLA